MVTLKHVIEEWKSVKNVTTTLNECQSLQKIEFHFFFGGGLTDEQLKTKELPLCELLSKK